MVNNTILIPQTINYLVEKRNMVNGNSHARLYVEIVIKIGGHYEPWGSSFITVLLCLQYWGLFTTKRKSPRRLARFSITT